MPKRREEKPTVEASPLAGMLYLAVYIGDRFVIYMYTGVGLSLCSI